MIYIFETNLPDNKKAHIALKKIYGLGANQSKSICKKLGFSNNLKLKELKTEQLKRLQILVEESSNRINSDLFYYKKLEFKKLLNMRSIKAIRRTKGLPVRGQRTHTNAKTAKKLKKF